MCGIAGFWLTRPADHAVDSIRAMTDALSHRGPDSSGHWYDEQSLVHLGHRRLAIQDLSPAGNQPMLSPSGRFTVVYNGEIYNNDELRRLLAGGETENRWRGTSDTETLLAAIEQWGLTETLKQANGMFAFALWDSQLRRLFLARDRMGEKPLYFGEHCGVLLFGSQLQAMRQFSGFRPSIDRHSVARFLACSNVPAPYSIYTGIHKLSAGCWVEFSRPALAAANFHRYWDLAAMTAQTRQTITCPEDAKARLSAQIEHSVTSRMLSDVPLGAFLSGGYDSSLVTALMQKNSPKPVKTFTIGFRESDFDEAHHARAVARYLGTDHQELYVDEQHTLDLVPRLSDWWDEPFSDSSQIPTYLLARLTRQHVTVSLSGDGGDELFGGYSRYADVLRRWQLRNHLPVSAQRALGHSVRNGSDCLSHWLRNVPAYRNSRLAPLVRVMGSTGDTLSKASFLDTYLHSARNWKKPQNLVRGVSDYHDPLNRSLVEPVESHLSKMMLCDALGYLPDTIMTKVDRASMAVGLECRAPLLDHQLVELALATHDSLKLQQGTGKWIIRELTHDLLPADVMERPKMGFGVPIEQWLCGALKDWAEDLLAEDLLERQGILHPAPIRTMWREFQSGQWKWHYYLWDVLMFQQWMQTHHPD